MFKTFTPSLPPPPRKSFCSNCSNLADLGCHNCKKKKLDLGPSIGCFQGNLGDCVLNVDIRGFYDLLKFGRFRVYKMSKILDLGLSLSFFFYSNEGGFVLNEGYSWIL